MRRAYVCVGPDHDTWRILRCDGCGREIPERVALCFSCLVGDCHGTLRRTRKYVPKADRW
jgi:hypothetical protein